jgi:hypothetical protein
MGQEAQLLADQVGIRDIEARAADRAPLVAVQYLQATKAGNIWASALVPTSPCVSSAAFTVVIIIAIVIISTSGSTATITVIIAVVIVVARVIA